MKNNTAALELTPTEHIPYSTAVARAGFLKGYISAAQKTNAHAFDPKFIESVDILCQFVEENPPMMIVQANSHTLDIDSLLSQLQKHSSGSEQT